MDPSLSDFLWVIGCSIVLGVVLWDSDWKRRLLETHHEKAARGAEVKKRQQ
ncbi:hypothetical protein SAMN05216600_1146 [Pseudomonas cuatrocienegasensis]|uniref:Uncharacterized protein n=1 Tax=Pseudomonas cuatrocienegasensis TaxID=543360 RepID=A0ABY1BK93_9PSED|nr:hypothetical protein SAMN05216600_1146 [Pseudomonas cuatrocienegasensis]